VPDTTQSSRKKLLTRLNTNILTLPTLKKTLSWLTLITLVGSLLTYGLIQAHKTPMMGDELTTYYLATLQTHTDLFQALKHGADSHGPFPHITNHIWFNLTEKNPQVWGRVPSILLWIGTGTILTCLLLQSLPLTLAVSLTLTLFLWPESQRHIAELRSYGWIMALLSTFLYTLINFTLNNQKRFLAGMALCSGVSFITHPIAVGYMGLCTATFTLYLLIPLKNPKRALKASAAWASGALWILPWIPNLIGQTQTRMTKEVRWAEPPNLLQLWEFAHPNPSLILVTLVWAALITTLTALPTLKPPKKNIPNTEEKNNPHGKLWLLAGLSFLLAAPLLWTASQFTNPLFTERYTLPTQIGWLLLSAGALSLALTKLKEQKRNLHPLKILKSPALIPTLFIFPLLIFTTKNPPRDTTGGFSNQNNPWEDIGIQELKYFTENLPIVCETSTTYLPRQFYNTQNKTYVLLLNTKGKNVEKMDYIMSKALGEADPRQKTTTLENLLKTYPRFYLINEPPTLTDQDIPKTFLRTTLNPTEVAENPQSLKLELVELIEPAKP
jgi:hypothetical protein